MTLSTIDLFNLSENEDYVYILDLDAMTQFVREFRGIWDKQFPHVIFAYSFKSNNIASVTQLMFREGFSAEVVSLHELKLAINDGFFGTNIFLMARLNWITRLSLRYQITLIFSVII